MIEVALFGAGRIGRIHGRHVAESTQARLRYVVDPDPSAAREVAEPAGAEAILDPEGALSDPSVGAVIVAAPTPAHVDLVVGAARAGKAIFCEKPIDLDLQRVDLALDEVERAQVPFFVGFNRRFDPSFAHLKAELARGAIGAVELVTITSRDPAPPPRAYLETSGGLFRDMMIHDFDMARWLLAEEPVRVFASASALVGTDAAEVGDVDTAAVVLETASGRIAQISNSRRATYGYDQRAEVHGSLGMLRVDNPRAHHVVAEGRDGGTQAVLQDFFLERYAEAYRRQMHHFLSALVDEDGPLLVGPHDGRQALVLAEAAQCSLATGAAVALDAFARRPRP